MSEQRLGLNDVIKPFPTVLGGSNNDIAFSVMSSIHIMIVSSVSLPITETQFVHCLNGRVGKNFVSVHSMEQLVCDIQYKLGAQSNTN